MLLIDVELKAERDLLLLQERSNISSVKPPLFKKYKILSKKDFEYLRSNSSKVSSATLAIYFCGNNFEHFRFASSLSAKKFNSVTRNRVKRVLREMIRAESSLKDLSIDALFVFYQTPENPILRTEIKKTLNKLVKK
jgi:ribonuclease P protein component